MAADFPQWVRNLVEKHGGSNLCLVMEKIIEKSDLDGQQNRLRIPKQCMAHYIVPMLPIYERIATNLVNIEAPPLNKERDGNAKKKKDEGRFHDALPIEIYNRAGWMFYSSLVHWDSSSIVLKNGEWMLFACLSGFKVGDGVEMWAFRSGAGRLCFVIAKKIDG